MSCLCLDQGTTGIAGGVCGEKEEVLMLDTGFWILDDDPNSRSVRLINIEHPGSRIENLVGPDPRWEKIL
jgi:hypothetical protein